MTVEILSKEEREEIISYGIERGKVICISIMVTLIIGYLLNAVFQSVVFLISLCSLRRYSGGYHADTPQRCYFISFLIVILSIILIKLINNCNVLCIVMQFINYMIIVLMAPVENPIKRLNQIEREKYGKKTKMVASVMCLVSVCLYWNAEYYIANPIGIACLVVGGLLVFGNIKNKRRGITGI